MPSVWVDASDVLDDISDKELVDELRRRKCDPGPDIKDLVFQIYYLFRGKAAPLPIRQLVWEVAGRVL